VFGEATTGAYVASLKSAWETLLLLANGIKPTRAGSGKRVSNRKALAQIDLHWHDLRHHAESRIMPRPWLAPEYPWGNHHSRPLHNRHNPGVFFGPASSPERGKTCRITTSPVRPRPSIMVLGHWTDISPHSLSI
jgi:hypothetical protein